MPRLHSERHEGLLREFQVLSALCKSGSSDGYIPDRALDLASSLQQPEPFRFNKMPQLHPRRLFGNFRTDFRHRTWAVERPGGGALTSFPHAYRSATSLHLSECQCTWRTRDGARNGELPRSICALWRCGRTAEAVGVRGARRWSCSGWVLRSGSQELCILAEVDKSLILLLKSKDSTH